MKTEDEVRAQRDYFWVAAQKAEIVGAQPEADAFAVLVGALDWVLEELWEGGGSIED